MSKFKIILFIIAVGFIVAGGVFLVKAITDAKEEQITVPYDFEEEVTDIELDIDTANVKFIKTTDSKLLVESIETEKNHCEVKVVDKKLVITQHQPKWYEQIGIFNVSLKLTIYLPNDTYKSLKVEDSTGNIDVPSGLTFDDVVINTSTGDIIFNATTNNDINIKVSTGDIKLEDVTCKNLKIKSSTGDKYLTNVATAGDITLDASTGKTFLDNVTGENLTMDSDTGKVVLKNTIMRGTITIKTDTGKVNLEGCDADTLSIKTDTGDIRGTILTDKQFIARTSTGEIDVPETSGNICRIETTTGDISIKIKPAS